MVTDSWASPSTPEPIIDALQRIAVAAPQTRVECTNCASDNWLDYVAAFGGVVGGIAAVVALIVALRSAKDAERSAVAAERTVNAAERSAELSEAAAKHAKEELEIQTAAWEAEQAERSKHPEFEVGHPVSYPLSTDPTKGPLQVVVEFGFKNVRTKPAAQVLVKFSARATCTLTDVVTGTGTVPSRSRSQRLGSRDEAGVDQKWRYFSLHQDAAMNISYLWDVRLSGGTPGSYPIRCKIVHAEAPGGGGIRDATVDLGTA